MSPSAYFHILRRGVLILSQFALLFWPLDMYCAICTYWHQRHVFAGGVHFVPQCSLLCFLSSVHTHMHTLTHIHCWWTPLSLSPPYFPSTPNPCVAHSASSASGRVAFILSVILSSPSVQFSPQPLQLLTGRETKRGQQNQPLPSTHLLAAMAHHQAAL